MARISAKCPADEVADAPLRVAAVGLCYLYLTRCDYFAKSFALCSGLLCATSPMFLINATQVLSEIPFLLLVIVALWAFDGQHEETAWRGGRQFLLGILLALPFLCRTIGLTLVFAGLLVQFLRGRPLRWMALGHGCDYAALVYLDDGGIGRAGTRDPISGYNTDYLSWWASINPTLALHIISQNILNILVSSAIVTLEALTVIPDSTHPMLRIIPVFLLGAIPLIAINRTFASLRLLPVFLISYLLLVLIWPWHPIRFMALLMPFWSVVPSKDSYFLQPLEAQVLVLPAFGIKRYAGSQRGFVL